MNAEYKFWYFGKFVERFYYIIYLYMFSSIIISILKLFI